MTAIEQTRGRAQAARFVPLLATVAFWPPALVLCGLGLWRPADGSWPLVAGLAVVWALTCSASRVAGAPALRWLLLLITTLGILTWPEAGLRLAGLRFDSAGVVRFGWPDLERSDGLRKDPELFWTLSPDLPDVNSRGFPGPEFALRKPPGVRRIVFLGDSCTQQGFPALVEDALARKAGADVRYEAINLGVAGYTSHQGRALASRFGTALRPDLAVVLFGWNDHWLAHGSTDAAKSSGRAVLLRRLSTGGSRVLQWLGDLATRGPQEPLSVPRVSLEEYRENLIAIADIVQSAGGRVLLLTAPSAHEQMGVPRFLIENRQARTERDVVEQHRAYNDAIRRLAAFRGYPLVDLAREADLSTHTASLFRSDGIHLTERGLQWIRDRVIEEIAAERPEWFAPQR